MVFLELLAFMLPCYVANAAPVLIGGGYRLDGGIKLGDGMGLFGKTKTVQGFAGGIAAGVLASGLISLAWPTLLFGNREVLFLSGSMLAVGALVGDAGGSFIKRRMGIKPGMHSKVLDQADFVIGALVFAYPFAKEVYVLPNIAFILVVSYLLHMGANLAANRAGLKKVPW
ncbi:MAG: CDP-2,3-bis-(O-geranylgeranyl)-sn-glycerol synthase [Candidatus Micrarchaeia archaeon]